MGKHKIWINEGIIHGQLSGVHDKKDAEAVIKDIHALLDKEGNGRVLIDMSNIEKATLEARKTHLNNLVSKPDLFYKLALFSANTMNRVMANLFIRAAQMGNKVKYFNSENDARDWLKE